MPLLTGSDQAPGYLHSIVNEFGSALSGSSKRSKIINLIETSSFDKVNNDALRIDFIFRNNTRGGNDKG